jgi:hypothetical protein
MLKCLKFAQPGQKPPAIASSCGGQQLAPQGSTAHAARISGHVAQQQHLPLSLLWIFYQAVAGPLLALQN